MKKSYEELITFKTFFERLKYLQCFSKVGEDTFGKYRYLNQEFYHSKEWRNFRDGIIVRDYGCDLAVPELEIHGQIILHHINPIDFEDVIDHKSSILDPNNVVCVSRHTHDAIHYGYDITEEEKPVTRRPNDTIPWR